MQRHSIVFNLPFQQGLFAAQASLTCAICKFLSTMASATILLFHSMYSSVCYGFSSNKNTHTLHIQFSMHVHVYTHNYILYSYNFMYAPCNIYYG